MKVLIFTYILLLAVCSSCTKKEKCINGYAYPRFASCLDIYTPVCGCDNVTYTNECHAVNADVSTWTEGECY